MSMRIIRPICFFDAETTGTNTQTDRIIELSVTKIYTDGSRETRTWVINPRIPIPKAASDIHNITDEMVKDAPYFEEAAADINGFMFGSDLFGFNSNDFDIPILAEEMRRAGEKFLDWEHNRVDVWKVYRALNPTNLSALYKLFTGNDLANAHSANTDVMATEVILGGIIDKHFDSEVTPEFLDKLVQGDRQRYDIAGKLYKNADGVVCWSFGPHIDKPYDSDLGFLQWVLGKDFPEDTKEKLRALLNAN